jgi:hypothetical protein
VHFPYNRDESVYCNNFCPDQTEFRCGSSNFNIMFYLKHPVSEYAACIHNAPRILDFMTTIYTFDLCRIKCREKNHLYSGMESM